MLAVTRQVNFPVQDIHPTETVDPGLQLEKPSLADNLPL